ncbi:hypothetical protein BHE74_00010607 [Ensete ventricosum]|nr:hypothetical protein BHE74_00010607 [Ensete ventricosum]
MPHPLCCISIDCPELGGRSPPVPAHPPPGRRGEGSSVAVAGVLCKWTNIGKGWRYRWFSLQSGVLSYSKIRRGDPPLVPGGGGVRLIGSAASLFSHPAAVPGGRRARKPVPVVRLKRLGGTLGSQTLGASQVPARHWLTLVSVGRIIRLGEGTGGRKSRLLLSYPGCWP